MFALRNPVWTGTVAQELPCGSNAAVFVAHRVPSCLHVAMAPLLQPHRASADQGPRYLVKPWAELAFKLLTGAMARHE
jgi:hypothetical protein